MYIYIYIYIYILTTATITLFYDGIYSHDYIGIPRYITLNSLK